MKEHPDTITEEALTIVGKVFKWIGPPMASSFYILNTLWLHTEYVILVYEDDMFETKFWKYFIVGGAMYCGLIMYWVHAYICFGPRPDVMAPGRDW